MLGVRGSIQREGEVVHLVVQRAADLSADLAGIGRRDATFPLPHGRGDRARHSAGPDPREQPSRGFRGCDLATLYGHISQLKMKTREFR